jgi:hypothetical protein
VWLKSHQSLRDHPKTRKLARRLGGVPAAIGHLHCLWWWCLDYATDGDLTRHDHEDIAIACEWDGDPGELIDALVACGFLDDKDGLRVHDWAEYAGQLILRREENRERARAHYAKKKGTVDDSTHRLRVDYAQSTQPDKKEKKEKKERAGGRATEVERSPARASEPTKLQNIVGKKLVECGLVQDGAA